MIFTQVTVFFLCFLKRENYSARMTVVKSRYVAAAHEVGQLHRNLLFLTAPPGYCTVCKYFFKYFSKFFHLQVILMCGLTQLSALSVSCCSAFLASCHCAENSKTFSLFVFLLRILRHNQNISFSQSLNMEVASS